MASDKVAAGWWWVRMRGPGPDGEGCPWEVAEVEHIDAEVVRLRRVSGNHLPVDHECIEWGPFVGTSPDPLEFDRQHASERAKLLREAEREVELLRSALSHSSSAQVFKGVLWRRDPVRVGGTKVYKTAVVGVLLSDRPLRTLEQPGEQPGTVVLAGECPGLAEALRVAEEGTLARRPGTADHVLTSLDSLVLTASDVGAKRMPGESWRDLVAREREGADDDEPARSLAVFDREVERGELSEAGIALAIVGGAQWVEV